MKADKTFLLVLFLLLFSSFVFAAPPGQTQGDLFLIYPKVEFLAVNTDITLNIVAAASTNEVIDNNFYDCDIHIHDSQGNHIIEDVMGNDTNGVNKNYTFSLSTTGLYSYNIWCESATDAGAASESFYVTPDGKDMKLYENETYLPLVILLIAIIAFSLWLSNSFTQDEFKWIKIILFLYAALNTFLLSAFALTLANYGSVSGLKDYLVVYFTVNVFILLFFIAFYWIGFYRMLGRTTINDQIRGNYKNPKSRRRKK